MFANWNAILEAINNGQYQAPFNQSANAPIPGLTGRTVGMAPPQQPLPTMGNHMFQASGPYGQQAMQMAGLLGGRMGIPHPPGGGMQINGLLGDKSRMPFYRPVK